MMSTTEVKCSGCTKVIPNDRLVFYIGFANTEYGLMLSIDPDDISAGQIFCSPDCIEKAGVPFSVLPITEIESTTSDGIISFNKNREAKSSDRNKIPRGLGFW